jgi:transmembrane sensor
MTDPIIEEAIAWFARSQSDRRTCADEDRLAHWLKQDPRHQTAYERVASLYRKAGPEITPRALPARRTSSSRGWAFAAAVLILILGGALIVRTDGLHTTRQTLTAVKRENRKIVMPDQSEIVLAAESSLATRYSATQRTVELDRGEAYFEVSKDPERPFTVHAGGVSITALGTAFDVREEAGFLHVAVTEGAVKITPRSFFSFGRVLSSDRTLAILKPGDEYILAAADKHGTIRRTQPTQAKSWISGTLEFSNEPLRSVVAAANRYLQQPVTIEDSSLQTLRISGVIHAGSTESLVGSLEASFPIKAIRTPAGTALIRKE